MRRCAGKNYKNQKMNPLISVFVMAYNEAGNLETTVGELIGVLSEMGAQYELVIIDDGSRDGTGSIADRIAENTKGARVIHHKKNKGLGGVYRTGFASALGSYLTFFPADGQFSAGIIKDFLPVMDEADMILGYIPNRKSSLASKSLSFFERIFLSFLFGPLPRFQGIIMFKRSLLTKINLRSSGRGWTVLMEFIIRARIAGCIMKSVPTTIRPRLSGASKVNNLSNIWSNLVQAVALRLAFNRK